MKLILKENIPNLGYKDEVVEVKDGYGRNYLIPQGKAVIASESALKRLAEDQKQRAHKIAKIREEAEELCRRIEGQRLVISAKTSANGTIFGSVGVAQIADELEKLGIEVDRRFIIVKAPVKEVGEYTAIVKPHRDAQVELTFEVISENAPKVEATEETVVEEKTEEKAAE